MPDFLVEVTLNVKVRADSKAVAEGMAVKIAQDYLLAHGHTLYLGLTPTGSKEAKPLPETL